MRLASVAVLAVLSSFVIAAAASAQAPQAAANQPAPKIVGARLRILDKIVARTSPIDVPINQEVKVGTLSITVRSCVVAPPEAPPESSAFLEITETKPSEQPKQIFSGWMFASSPALSSLEHPVYDVWVVGCKTEASAPPPPPAKSR